MQNAKELGKTQFSKFLAIVDGRVKFNFIEDYICQSSVFRLFQRSEAEVENLDVDGRDTICGICTKKVASSENLPLICVIPH